jgi:hypothetical protein
MSFRFTSSYNKTRFNNLSFYFIESSLFYIMQPDIVYFIDITLSSFILSHAISSFSNNTIYLFHAKSKSSLSSTLSISFCHPIFILSPYLVILPPYFYHVTLSFCILSSSLIHCYSIFSLSSPFYHAILS